MYLCDDVETVLADDPRTELFLSASTNGASNRCSMQNCHLENPPFYVSLPVESRDKAVSPRHSERMSADVEGGMVCRVHERDTRHTLSRNAAFRRIVGGG